MASKTTRLFLLAIPLLGLSFGIALGQGDKATVVGTVTDQSGGVIPGVEVSLTRASTNEVFTGLTTETGDFAIRGVIPDVYQMRVSLPGFKTEVRSGLKLGVGGTYRMDTQLSVGEVAQVVEVESTTPILKTEAPELGQVIDNKKIVSIPLNQRDVFGVLGALTPGVQPQRDSFTGSGVQYNVKGMRRTDNFAMLDGTMISETNGSLQFFVNPDAVQEFEIKSGLYGAEYGVKPGGQFSAITKSGTNDLHGTLFWYHRNDNLDARNFFDPGPRPEFKRNQFGAVVGGPMVIPGLLDGKDKAWWFFAYSGERIRRFLSLTGNVPTAEERNGIFSEEIIDPQTGQPFPNNTIPRGRFNDVAQKLIPFYPDANTTGRGFNYTSASSGNIDRDEIIAKMDFKTGPDSRWSSRFLWSDRPINRVNAIDVFTEEFRLYNLSQNVTNTRNFGTSIVNEAGVHWYYRPYYPGDPHPLGFGPTLGITNWPISFGDVDGVPVTNVTGLLRNGSFSKTGFIPEGQWEVKENLSFTKGSHFIKTGYHYRYHFVGRTEQNRSQFTFTNDRFTGNAFANLLLGDLTRSFDGKESYLRNGLPGHYFYVQDSWKVRPRLTLNLGLRYELRLGWIDRRGFSSNLRADCVVQNPLDPLPQCFDPKVTIADAVFPATGRFEANAPIWDMTKTGWQPRLGLSFRLTDDTVIRAGGGIYGNEPLGGMIYGAVLRNPRANAAQLDYISNKDTPTLSLSNPFDLTAQASGVGLPNAGGFQSPMPQWYVPSWGLSVQHRLSENTLFEVGYQGTRSVHEMLIMTFNDAVPGPGDRQSRRPFPTLQNYQYLQGNGSANYNGLEFKFEKRPGPEGLTALLAYTWAKGIDTMGGRGGVAGDPREISRNRTLRENRGLGEGNIPGRLAMLAGYDVPSPQEGVLRQILGGWSVFGILTLQKGQWFTPADTDRLDVGSSAGQRPFVIGVPNLPSGQRSPQRWFNTGAYCCKSEAELIANGLPLHTYGNAGRGTLEGPGLGNLDISVMRSFKTSEESRLEFRFEAFNLTNHTNFQVPTNSFASGSFGVVGRAAEARDLQFGFKFYF